MNIEIEKGKMIRKLTHKVLLFLFLLAVSAVQLKGQEFPSSLQYINNMQTLNPAFVGMWDRAGFLVSTRANWVGFNGAMLVQKLGYFSPVKEKGGGFGINIERVTYGMEKKLYFTGDYSYQIRLDIYTYMRFGLRAGIVNYDNVLPDYQLYPDYIPDSEFASDIRLYFMSVLGFGAMIYNEDYFVSLSIPQIVGNTFKAVSYTHLTLPTTPYV